LKRIAALERAGGSIIKIGLTIYGIASVAFGILDLIWGEFEPAHQPLQAWGDHVPGATIFAYIAAIWLMVGGAAILWRRSVRFGAAALAILYGIFMLFPLPRLYTAPHYLGQRVNVYIGVVANVCEQIFLFVPIAAVWGMLATQGSMPRKASSAARLAFGFCSLFFGLSHLTNIQDVVPMVPIWLPWGGAFWAALTGIAFVLAGLAIMTGVLDSLAAWLLGAMLAVFSVLALAPLIFAAPHDHTSWGGNAYNLTAIGGAWIMAEWLAGRRHSDEHPQGAHAA
jgi:uncharacterized membrane protein